MADTTRMGPADEAFNRGDAAYFDLYRDDVAVHGLPGMGGTVDKQGVIEFYSAFWSAFPDAKIEPVEMIVGDELVAVRLHVKGTPSRRDHWRTPVWQRRRRRGDHDLQAR